MAEEYSTIYLYSFSIHSSIHGHMDCFHILAIVSNIGVKIFFQITFQVSLVKFPGVESLGNKAVQFLIF